MDELEFYAAGERAAAILPAWFVSRMMGDTWSFALLTTDRTAILISTIMNVRQAADGSIWLDVELLESDEWKFWQNNLCAMGYQILTAPTSRTSARVNAAGQVHG